MAPTCTADETPLEFHCESPMCEWWRCPDCCATYDVERCIRVLRDGHVEAF